MELWIRSQDKMKLVKVNYCYIMDQQDHFTIIGETIDSGPIVGTYATKERALEVLDEILEELRGANILEYLNKNNGNMNNVFPILTYQMPKE